MSKHARRRSDRTPQHPAVFAYLEEGKPLLLLDLARTAAAGEPAKEPARRPSRRTVGVASVLAATLTGGAVLSSLPASADDKPTRVLQAVDIALGSDGSIDTVASTNVRRTDGKTSSDKVLLDPTKVAADLPVRVLTSYVHDGRTGTDLADLKGARGRVQITVTVQNTTVHPEKVEYDGSKGEPRTRFALIGTPMTVTASATLPQSSIATVVQPQTGTKGTDGVLGKAANGDTTVQWAALLAPPRLSSSATFTLVEDATDFRLPRFDLAVQPGLVTDTSVDRLLREAFSKTGTSQLTLESKTIELISRVNGTLQSAGKILRTTKAALAGGADTLGSQLVGELISSATQVDDAAGSLSNDLDDLKTSLSSALSTSNDAITGTLLDAVTRLSAYLGEPDGTTPTALPVTPGCQVQAPAAVDSPTLYAQLFRVSQQLLTLRSATQGCSDQIAAAIDATLGDPSTCVAGSPSVTCTLLDAQGRLVNVATYISTEGSKLIGQFDPSNVDRVTAAVTALTTAVTGIQDAAAALKTGKTPDSLVAQLTALSTSLDGILAGLAPTGNGLGRAVADINAKANAQLAVLGRTAADGTLRGQAQSVADAVCAVPTALATPDPESAAYVSRLRALVAGTECGTPSVATTPDATYPTPLVDRLTAEYDAWSAVATLTDVTASRPQGAALELATLTDTVTAVKSAVGDILTGLSGTPSGSLGNKLSTLTTLISQVYVPPASATTCPVVPPTVPLPALNALQTAFGTLACNQAGLGTRLGQVLSSATPVYSKAATDLGGAVTQTDQARLAAEASLASLLSTLNGALAGAATDSLAQGSKTITAQRLALQGEADDIRSTLSGATEGAIRSIGASLDQSNRDLRASTELLAAGIRRVQVDLGDGSGSKGLLGVVSSSAGLTGSSGDQVLSAQESANRFGGVRSSELDDVFLQQAQLARALALQAAYPAFALKLPAGSSSSAVFSFHLRGI